MISITNIEPISTDYDVSYRFIIIDGPELDHVRVITCGEITFEIMDMVVFDKDVLGLGYCYAISSDRVDVVAADVKICSSANGKPSVEFEDFVIFNCNI